MITLIVGHRGTGKSRFLKSFEKIFPGVESFDLDSCVERFTNKSIPEIFANDGEETFRAYEEEVLLRLVSGLEAGSRSAVISLGGGYRGTIPEDCEVLWLRRESDRLGRIFFDRPRLHSKLRPLEEWDMVFDERDCRYQSQATRIWTQPEGIPESGDPILEAFLTNNVDVRGAWITLLNSNFFNELNFKRWIEEKLKWNFGKFELRLDLLTERELSIALEVIPREKLLLSFRPGQRLNQRPLKGVDMDWDITLGLYPFAVAPRILSLHERRGGESIEDLTKRMEEAKNSDARFRASILKLSVEIRSMDELQKGLAWARTHPGERVFLPRSTDGRLRWFRLHFRDTNAFNFIREADGSSLDQPTIYEWLSAARVNAPDFAAVLGDPVLHSFSPQFHREFFETLKMPFYRITLSRVDVASNPTSKDCQPSVSAKNSKESLSVEKTVQAPTSKLVSNTSIDEKLRQVALAEMSKESAQQIGTSQGLMEANAKLSLSDLQMKHALLDLEGGQEASSLQILKNFGLRYAAVTAPLKSWAWEQADKKSQRSSQFNVANTLFVGSEVFCALTDFEAIRLWLAQNGVRAAESLIWGQGAMGSLLYSLLPAAEFLSIRDTESLTKVANSTASNLIWAGGSAREFKECPRISSSFKRVYDLNYREDSQAREWAALLGLKYFSGIEIFDTQAKLQQMIWREQNVTSQFVW